MVPNISVIIPTLNNRKLFLESAIQSVQRQILRPLEIIIVNNGIDRNMVIYPKLPSKIQIHTISTVSFSGASQARNIGATIAQGQYLAFLDDDDLWPSNYLSQMFKLLINEKAKLCVSRIAVLETNKVRSLFDASNLMRTDLLRLVNPGITGSNILIEKNHFFDIGGYDVELSTGEDSDLALKSMLVGERIPVNTLTSILLRNHDGERLTSKINLVKGYRKLYIKYKNEVSVRNRIYLFWRMKRENNHLHSTIFSKIILFSSTIMILLLRRRPRDIYTFPKKPQSWDTLESFMSEYSF